MARLIQLKQRIKAIETTKKITHAMRLIAMSTHSHLKSVQDPLIMYIHSLETLFSEIASVATEWHNPILSSHSNIHNKHLLIIIGSQKGLCGSFNSNLLTLVTHTLNKKNYSSQELDIIAIGQKTIDFVRHLSSYSLKHAYEKLNIYRMQHIAQEIAHIIMHASIPYTSVSIASNTFKSFFTQKPSITHLIPFQPHKTTLAHAEEYLWDQSAKDILDILVPQYLSSQLYHFLFQSLLAEHAARFISMDSATRNANSLLESSTLEYNKLRQAKITKELTELTGSFN